MHGMSIFCLLSYEPQCNGGFKAAVQSAICDEVHVAIAWKSCSPMFAGRDVPDLMYSARAVNCLQREGWYILWLSAAGSQLPGRSVPDTALLIGMGLPALWVCEIQSHSTPATMKWYPGGNLAAAYQSAQCRNLVAEATL